MPATVIAERIGWDRSIRALTGRVAELRPAYLPPDPASRTTYAAGEMIAPAATCDGLDSSVSLDREIGIRSPGCYPLTS